MDDEVQDVLNRLSDCAIDHALQSRSKVTVSKVTPSISELPKDSSNLCFTSSNVTSSTCLGSTAFYGRERCGIHEKSSMSRLNSFNEIAQSECNDVAKNMLDKNFDVSDLEKVMEACAPLDFQDLTRIAMDSIKEKCVGAHHKSTLVDFTRDMKDVFLRTREGSVLSQTTARLGPPLLRTASIGPHAKKEDDADKHQPRDSKTSTQKSRPRKIISVQTLVEDQPRAKNVGRHRGRSGIRRNAHLGLPSNQRTKRRKASISTSTSTSTSTSASPYSSRASRRSKEDEDSVSGRIMKNPLSSRGVSQCSVVGPSHKAGPTAEKQVGPLRRMKNKLAVIFHHHHHHHLHHHQGGAKVGSTMSSNHTHSFWKYLSKMVQRRSGDDVQGKKSRGGHHGLIDGLIKHVWHSKKPKRPGDLEGLGKSHRQKKKVEKWHWWQKIYKHSGGVVRMNSIRRPRVRLGFKAKKRPQQLRALTMH